MKILNSLFTAAITLYGFGCVAQNVGIGTAAPGAKLEVISSSATNTILRAPIAATGDMNKLVFLHTTGASVMNAQVAGISDNFATSSSGLAFLTTSSSATTEKMRIKGDGTVGIGLTAPLSFLHVRSGNPGTTPSALNIENALQSMLFINNNGWTGFGTSSPAGNFVIRPGIAGVWPSGTYDGIRIIHPNQSSTTTDGFMIGVDQGFGTEAVIWNFENDDILFGVNNSEMMRIEQTSGDVGIGTNTPVNILHLNETNAINAPEGLRMTWPGSGSSSSDGLFLGFDIGTGDGMLWHYETEPLTFGTSNTEQMRITSNGFVGISTNNPTAYLHIHDDNAINPSVKLTTVSATSGAEFYMANLGDVILRANESGRSLTMQASGSTLVLDAFSNINATMSGNLDLNGTFKVTAAGDLIEIKDVGYSWPSANAAGVLTNNGSGVLSWSASAGGGTLDYAYDFGGAGAGRTITADAGAVSIYGTDGLIVTGAFGSGASIGSSGAGTRMFYNPRKAAFRAGYVDNSQWDEASVGNYSMAAGLATVASGVASTSLGHYNTASGDYSSAIGGSCIASEQYATALGGQATASGYGSTSAGVVTLASGYGSTALGWVTTASGDYSSALGSNTFAESAHEFSIGNWNTDYVPSSTTLWNGGDRLFVVGNGTASGSRSDAMVILKNGNIGIGNSSPSEKLEIGGTSSRMYMNSGTSNHIIFNTNGIAAPAYTTRSVGTKVVLYPQVDASNVDYALGINGATLWYSVPQGASGYQHVFYGGTNELMRVRGDGRLGLGTTNPAYAVMQVQGMVGNTVAYFSGSANSKGVAVISDWPGIYFNCYYSGGTKAMSASGYPAQINGEQSVGGITFHTTNVANTTADAAVTLSERMRIAANGNVGIGAITPGYLLQVGLSADGTSAIANAWNTFSDRRWKTDIRLIPNALGKVGELNGYYYEWIDGEDQSTQVGVIAQEVEAVLPEIVTTAGDGYKSVDYSKLSALLIESTKELHQIILTQQEQLVQQQKDIEWLKERLNEVEASASR